MEIASEDVAIGSMGMKISLSGVVEEARAQPGLRLRLLSDKGLVKLLATGISNFINEST
jgi:hypothetical protein